MKFEVCAVNLASALAAQRAGAHRIELCTSLDSGGLTPSVGLLRAVLNALDLPVHVLIRVREGDFIYTEAEKNILLEDIRFCRTEGAAGVVVGALTADHRLDLDFLGHCRDAAGDLALTCHRAFDFTRSPEASLEALIGLGFDRVLSSGQAATAFEGRFLLQKLVAQAAGRIAVMPGGGITAQNIRTILEFTGAQDAHFTGKKKVASSGGGTLPGLELWHWESDEAEIRAICANALSA
ncbi:MAG: copper homeostasis protein CutC [Saprospiraceae bacterium]|nr:copper homeostasis protein CutC [Saprospiraceae bacterium]